MHVAYILLWAAAATASKQPGRPLSDFNSEDGSRTVTNEDSDDVTTPYVYCDPKIEDTCYDESFKAVSCSLISEGGCPCPTGQSRCDADLANGCVGWCTEVCCDWTNEYVCEGSKECAKHGDPCPCPDGKKECYPGSAVCSSICVDCDDSTEETCYGREGTASSCAKYADGGCPCPDGEERCGAGWCAMECCDGNDETCFDYDQGYLQPATQYCKAIADGGCPCPTGQEKCGADLSIGHTGYCSEVCCDFNTEEQCFNPPSCAVISSGGCPCPQGQEKCRADLANNYTGYCTDACCDLDTEETCYSTGCIFYEYCVAIADGGCPCPEGMERCGADLDHNILGWCDYICCDTATEEKCYDWDGNSGIPITSCAAFADGGCPCPEGTERCGADLDNNIVGWCTDICCDATTELLCYNLDEIDYYDPYCAPLVDGGGCPDGSGADSYLRHLEAKLEKLPTMNGGNDFEKGTSREKFALKEKIESLRHAIKFNALPAHLSVGKNHEQ